MPRLSRNEAARQLDQIIAAALEFNATEITHAARTHRDYLDDYTLRTPRFPDAALISGLRSQVAKLQAERLFNSTTIRPLTSPAITVYLFGARCSLFSATEEAAVLAAQELSVSPDELRLVDHTPVSTATWTGARYTFRVRAAWDPAPAPAPAEAPSAAAPGL